MAGEGKEEKRQGQGKRERVTPWHTRLLAACVYLSASSFSSISYILTYIHDPTGGTWIFDARPVLGSLFLCPCVVADPHFNPVASGWVQKAQPDQAIVHAKQILPMLSLVCLLWCVRA